MAIDNKYTGATPLKLGDKQYTLRFSWPALAEIYTLLNGRTFASVIRGINTADLAKVIVIGLREHNPEITEEFIMNLSPPLKPIIDAIDKALFRAMHGKDMPENSDSENSSPPA